MVQAWLENLVCYKGPMDGTGHPISTLEVADYVHGALMVQVDGCVPFQFGWSYKGAYMGGWYAVLTALEREFKHDATTFVYPYADQGEPKLEFILGEKRGADPHIVLRGRFMDDSGFA